MTKRAARTRAFQSMSRICKSGVAAPLCHRSPKILSDENMSVPKRQRLPVSSSAIVKQLLTLLGSPPATDEQVIECKRLVRSVWQDGHRVGVHDEHTNPRRKRVLPHSEEKG